MTNRVVVYIHGKGGSASEADHYRAFFPNREVIGFDYSAQTPWAAQEEFARFFEGVSARAEHIVLVANSIGAYYAMCALAKKSIEKAYFISPIVDMEGLILGMMRAERVSESELREKKVVKTSFGEDLSWEYLAWVREHPVDWHIPTEILYGKKDALQSIEMIRAFAARSDAGVTVMRGGEHWFHTEEQMRFLDEWLRSKV
ncbi:MAG: alpha/beta hydrolase [Clostridia bacterium]|nr:alpha/beta hydrolase [Clostridia bacterium]